MNDLTQECVDRTADLKRLILALEERMDTSPNTVEAEEILDIRSRLIDVGSVVGDQLPPLQSLSTTDKAFFKLADARDFMNCALANLKSAERTLDWLDRRIRDLRSGFQMNAQEKTNRRLNLLTILSAIFTPIRVGRYLGHEFRDDARIEVSFRVSDSVGLMVLIGAGNVSVLPPRGLVRLDAQWGASGRQADHQTVGYRGGCQFQALHRCNGYAGCAENCHWQSCYRSKTRCGWSCFTGWFHRMRTCPHHALVVHNEILFRSLRVLAVRSSGAAMAQHGEHILAGE